MFDFHCHLQNEKDFPFENYIANLSEDLHLHIVSTSPYSWHDCLKFLDRPNTQVSIGIHPWYIKKANNHWTEELNRLLKKHPQLHIGETGFDVINSESPVEIQSEFLMHHLQLAYLQNSTVSTHCVRSWHALLSVLKMFYQKKELPRCIIHDFNSSIEIARELEWLGVRLSFGGRLLDPKNSKLRQTFLNVQNPLPESDAPWFQAKTPSPYTQEINTVIDFFKSQRPELSVDRFKKEWKLLFP